MPESRGRLSLASHLASYTDYPLPECRKILALSGASADAHPKGSEDAARTEADRAVGAFRQRRTTASQPPRTEEEKFAANVARDFIARQTSAETVGTSSAALAAFGNSRAAAPVTAVRADEYDSCSRPVNDGTVPPPMNAEEAYADAIVAAFLNNGARK
jgi:hypothetical protein